MPAMAGLLRIPAGRMDVVPLGINMSGYERRRTSSDDVFRVGYFARIAPEKGLHLLAEAYKRFRDRTAGAPVRLEAAGYLSRAQEPYLEEIRGDLEQAGLAHEFTYHGAVDRDGKLAFLRTLDVLVGARALRRAQGRVPARGDGERRARRAAAARRVHRNRREDRRRSARARRTMRRRSPRRSTVCGAIAVCARRWRIAGSTVSDSTTRSRDPPIDCLRRTTPLSRVPRSARRMPGPLLQVADLTKEYPTPRGALRVLSSVSFSLAAGDAAAVMGPSGSGKSSLLYILGGLEPPTSGSVTLDGRNPFQLDARGWRRSATGRSGSSSRTTACCRSARCSRTCSSRRSSRRIATMLGTRASARRAGRPRRPHRSPAGGAVGRRAAAGRHRARADPAAAGCSCATSRPATSIAPPPRTSPRCCSSCTGSRTRS